MTQDEIVEMARQSELGFLLGDNWMLHHELEYFAKLVAQHEREACADLCMWRTGIQQVDAAVDTCAAAIRARSNE